MSFHVPSLVQSSLPPSLGGSDEQLWSRFVSEGCERSLSELHRRYLGPLNAWLRRCGIRDAATQADLSQDVWIRLLNNRGSFDPAKRWATWAFHIARNVASNESRRVRRRTVTPEADFCTEDETIQVRDALSTTLPDAMMQERELSAELRRVLSGLTLEQRTIFTLRFIEGCTNAEVSQELGIELDALKAKAKRVRRKVLDAMQAMLSDDP